MDETTLFPTETPDGTDAITSGTNVLPHHVDEDTGKLFHDALANTSDGVQVFESQIDLTDRSPGVHLTDNNENDAEDSSKNDDAYFDPQRSEGDDDNHRGGKSKETMTRESEGAELAGETHENNNNENVVQQKDTETDSAASGRKDDENNIDKAGEDNSKNVIEVANEAQLPKKKAHRVHNFSYTLLQKIDFVLEAKETSMAAVSRKYNIDRSKLHGWKKNFNTIWERARINPNAKSAHLGCSRGRKHRKDDDSSDITDTDFNKQKKKPIPKPKHSCILTVQEKLAMVLEAEENAKAGKNYTETAAKYNVTCDQLRYWRKQLPLLQTKVKQNATSYWAKPSKLPNKPSHVFLDRIWDPADDCNMADNGNNAKKRSRDSDDSDDEDSCDDSNYFEENILLKYADDNGSDDETYLADDKSESTDDDLEAICNVKEVYLIKETEDKNNGNDFSDDSVQSVMNEKEIYINLEAADDGYSEEVLQSMKSPIPQVDNGTEINIPKQKKKHKKHKYIYTVKQKVDIVKEALESKNFRATARKYEVDNKAVFGWAKALPLLEEKSKLNPRALTCGFGMKMKAEKFNVEQKMTDWITEMISMGVAVTTQHIRDKAVEVNPNFYGGDKKKQKTWVYKFLLRRNIELPRGGI